MKVISELLNGNPITAIANAVDTLGNVALKAIPSDAERELRLRLNTAAIQARSNKRATQHQKKELLLKIRAIRKGIKVAKAFNRPLDELNSDLDRVLALMGD